MKKGQRIKRVIVQFEQDGEDFELDMKGEFHDQECKFDLVVVGHTPDYAALWEMPQTYMHSLLELRAAKHAPHDNTTPLYTIRKVMNNGR